MMLPSDLHTYRSERKPNVADVSILTASLNYGRFIGDAILSVLGQTDVSVQHVVQDGASVDETVEVLTRFGERVDWSSSSDAGQSDALNQALSRATGRWIAWLNADEFYLPRGLASLVETGEQSGADVIYGDSVFVDQAGRMERLLAPYRFSPRVLKTYGPFISSCSVIIRRSALGEGPWDVGIHRVMDWDLYMRLLQSGANFLHTLYPAGAFRLHPAQVTATSWEHWEQEDELVGIRHGRSTDSSERWKSFKRGRVLHRGHKLLGGSYLREIRARAFRGRDLCWFHSDSAQATFVEFLERCYRRSQAARLAG
jgi:glycosyltransferase involved in cell wall biosynthesis